MLTDESLGQRIAPGFRALGELAWHVAGSIPHIARQTGLVVDGPDDRGTPAPNQAIALTAAYRRAADSFAQAVAGCWTDDSLRVTDRMYGEDWMRGKTLEVILAHEIHHRGQMTVLMRQAGLPVPGLYGPPRRGPQPPR